MTLNIVQTTVGKIPPWHIVLPDVDQTLASQVKKKDAPHILNALACEKINQQYADHVHIYTDASKDSSGKVGIGCHIRLSSTSQSIDKVARLTDGVAVQTGELAAIRMALQNIYLLENSTSYQRYAIFTDSLSSVQNFSTNASRNRPNLYIEATEFIQKLQSYVTLIWIPSHIGIPGNERADCLANIGTKLQ